MENIMLMDFTSRPKPREPENDHIVLVHSDGTVVYEDGYDPTQYCDIYYCYECPRYGDDCDGEVENE